jgi:hypothetical protein
MFQQYHRQVAIFRMIIICKDVLPCLQEYSEQMAGPAPTTNPAKPASPPAAGNPGSPGGSPPANMNRTVVHVAARRQELLDREVSATSWKVGSPSCTADWRRTGAA